MFKKAIIGILGVGGIVCLGKIGWNLYEELMGYRLFMILNRIDFFEEFMHLNEEEQGWILSEIGRLMLRNRFDVDSVVDYILA